MMTSQEVLSQYEAMVEITEQMVQAAVQSDWELLETLEKRVAGHARALRENEAPAQLEAALRLKKVQIIKKLLDDDRKIRDLTLPWMAHLSKLINSTGTERRLVNAYGAA
ncbi:flagellar protein FliT [Janthinobacterium agaricidamnosum]|uniref:Flagellar protein FliT n=1 Tax=Janthinobacterium agaricidamnosum NBRC 102515 = DSM 9628 TaxID=1349767 RepID=W0V2T3_9BURK|nr:flagellar protein FliT [Janthinobacterium agaricidamnosum]CDG81905.1 fliT flagellar protein [Janthinobacterium agaricidamnosum NBRC 102515 = DSM 9628]